MSPAQYMEMQVKHALTTILTGIDDETIPESAIPFNVPILLPASINHPSSPTSESSSSAIDVTCFRGMTSV